MASSLSRLVESKPFRTFIILAIVLAAVVVGCETSPALVRRHGALLHALDRLILFIFAGEIVLKLLALGRRPWLFFRDPWNVFDFLVVAVGLLPLHAEFVAVFRLVRILRVLRLITVLPRLRVLVGALLKSIPSIGYVGMLLAILFYLYGVMAVFLFGRNDPLHFGSLPLAFLSLFQILTLEGWVDLMRIQLYGCDRFGYADQAALCTDPQAHPVLAIFFFVSFIVFGTMIALNLFIGVIMNGMEEMNQEQSDEALRRAGKAHPEAQEALSALAANLEKARRDMDSLKRALTEKR